MKDAIAILPIALDSKAAAKALGFSLSLLYQLDAEHRLPAGTKLHTKKMFDVRTLRAWSLAGMPHRDSPEWKAILQRLGAE